MYPDYRRLWIATGCAQSASWALIILRGALVYNLTQSNTWVGFVTMAAHLPSLVVTPFAGFLADRLDRRRVLAATYSLNLAHNVILALLRANNPIFAGVRRTGGSGPTQRETADHDAKANADAATASAAAIEAERQRITNARAPS